VKSGPELAKKATSVQNLIQNQPKQGRIEIEKVMIDLLIESSIMIKIKDQWGLSDQRRWSNGMI
jgi:hypothetical protein